MCPDSVVFCPHLKGSAQGALCGVVNSFMKDIEDADIRLCMSARFEVCHRYLSSLMRLKANPGSRAVAQ